jgi:hypothetical protein
VAPAGAGQPPGGAAAGRRLTLEEQAALLIRSFGSPAPAADASVRAEPRAADLSVRGGGAVEVRPNPPPACPPGLRPGT